MGPSTSFDEATAAETTAPTWAGSAARGAPTAQRPPALMATRSRSTRTSVSAPASAPSPSGAAPGPCPAAMTHTPRPGDEARARSCSRALSLRELG